ncbi:unnamed protein product [Closterium sp. NIES-65]|nr:unnamed protein product [Closterium sp. NIES-65]
MALFPPRPSWPCFLPAPHGPVSSPPLMALFPPRPSWPCFLPAPHGPVSSPPLMALFPPRPSWPCFLPAPHGPLSLKDCFVLLIPRPLPTLTVPLPTLTVPLPTLTVPLPTLTMSLPTLTVSLPTGRLALFQRRLKDQSLLLIQCAPPHCHRAQVEVAAMTAMQHPKILQLLGYVGDSPSPVLVYEFIPRGDCTDMLKQLAMRCAHGAGWLCGVHMGLSGYERVVSGRRGLQREEKQRYGEGRVGGVGERRGRRSPAAHPTSSHYFSEPSCAPILTCTTVSSPLRLLLTSPLSRNLLMAAAKGEVHFPWRARLVVALGCAEALAAIHDANFVHRDFKASNVLLREDLTPVLADFGLAKSVTDWATHVSTRVMGSMGYMDPIYFQTGQLSRKSDTYAFGVFLLELVSGCLALDDRFQELRKLVVAKTFPDPELVVDPRIKGEWTKKQVFIVFTLIRFAIFFDWDNRPSMSVMRDKLMTVVE